jgi:DNA-binding Lrp family transcriptional regulator
MVSGKDRTDATMQFDKLDFMLLAELCTNARRSHVELSERVGLSTTACARRLKSLEGSVIAGYHASLDLKQLGLGTTVVVRISLESQSEEALEAFEKAVIESPSVVRCFLMSGSDDYLVTVIARDIEDFERIHKTQLSRLPKVSRIQSSFALREVVNRIAPPAAFQQWRAARRP